MKSYRCIVLFLLRVRGATKHLRLKWHLSVIAASSVETASTFGDIYVAQPVLDTALTIVTGSGAVLTCLIGEGRVAQHG